jgi:hypothetical protein
MALDRYERSITEITGTRPYDQASSKEAFKSSQSLEARLDSISNYLYQGLEKQRAEAGSQFGVSNRPTLEQIKIATYNGNDPSTLFAEGGTVYGDAAREAQAEMYRQDLEQDLSYEFNSMFSAIDAGYIPPDPDVFKSDLQAKIDGASNVLTNISPAQNLKFRAASAGMAYKVVDKLNAKIVDRINAENQLKLNNGIDAYAKTYLQVLKDTNGNYLEAEEMMIIDQNRINEYLHMLPGTNNANIDAFNEAKENAQTEAISSYVIDNYDNYIPEGSNIVTELNKGNYGNYTGLFSSMDIEAQSKLQEIILKRFTEDNNLIQQTNEVLKNENSNYVGGIYTKLGAGTITPNQAIIDITKKGIPLSLTERNLILSPTQKTDQTITETALLKSQLAGGTVTTEDLRTKLTLRKITATDYAVLMDEYTNVTLKVTSGIIRIREGLKISENSDLALLPTLQKEEYARLVTALMDRGRAAFTTGSAFNSRDVADELLSTNKATTERARKEDNYRDLGAIIGVKITDDNYYLYDTIEEIQALEGLDLRKNKIKDISNILIELNERY